jgi:hypothetical protein
MKQHVVWVHGIGTHQPGYSRQEGWQSTLQAYWPSGDDQFAEVCWDTVFTQDARRRRSPGLESAEDPAAAALRLELERTIAERQVAIASDPNRPPLVQPGGTGSDTQESDRLERGIIGNALGFLNNSVGDFVRYLTNNTLREAVKNEFKKVVEPLLQADASVAVVSHSWGTVVAYESLHDLNASLRGKRVAALFTLGSPLWMPPIRGLVRPSATKPANVDLWVNIAAHGDAIGGWLYSYYGLDRDFQAPGVAGVGAHSSYFAAGNAGVMQDLVSRFLLR